MRTEISADDSSKVNEKSQSKPGDQLSKCLAEVKVYLITAYYWIYSDNTPATHIQVAEQIWVCPQFHECNSRKIPGRGWNKTLTQRGRKKPPANVALNNIDNCGTSVEFLFIYLFFGGGGSEVEMDLLSSQFEPDLIITLVKAFRCISCIAPLPHPHPTLPYPTLPHPKPPWPPGMSSDSILLSE